MLPLVSHVKKYDKQYIIFDFDKTLFHIQLDWENYFDDIKEMLISNNADILKQYELENISWSEMQNMYVSQYGDSLKDIICENNKRAEKKLFRGVIANEPLLEELTQIPNCTFYIWSSNVKELIEQVLLEYNIRHLFSKIISRSEVSFLKPKPEGFTLINSNNYKPAEFLFVGDSIADEQAAAILDIDFYKIEYFL